MPATSIKPTLLTHSSASISADGHFRYCLRRRWKTLGPNLCFLMLNPSKADAHQDDPTVRRCMAIARRMDYAGIVIVNLFAFRSTDPNVLQDNSLYIGQMNMYHIQEAVDYVDKVICSWGVHPIANNQARRVGTILDKAGMSDKLYCLRMTSNGYPMHPLFADSSLIPIPFNIPRSLLRVRLITH